MIPQPPKKLLVAGHLEFGDALILNGLIRTLAKQEPAIAWLTGSTNIRAVRAIVSDLKNVEVLASVSYDEVRNSWLPVWPHKLPLGYFSSKGFDESKWDSEMYRQAGIPFESRWSESKFPARLAYRPDIYPKRDTVLIHEKPEKAWFVRRDMLPAGLEQVRVIPRPSILDWLPDIYSARELHFIDSSFLNLAESLYAMGFLRNTKMVFHRYAKVYSGPAKWPVLRAPWMIFD